jgi:hypothetical protein
MARRLTGPVTTAAVLSIILGVLLLGCGTCGTVTSLTLTDSFHGADLARINSGT